MTDNPFEEASDQDRTVIRPMPGGKRPAAAAPPPRVVAASAAPEVASVEVPTLGDNKLTEAAQPLLQLLARLRNTAHPPDAGDLLARVLAEFRRFEQTARSAGIAMEQLRPAHYALCASLDDAVLNTPWGAGSAWTKSGMVSSFHPDIAGGERFVEVLAKLRQQASQNLPAIELMYLCLSFGFMGRFRSAQGGTEAVERLRQEVAEEIAAQRAPVPKPLSAQWKGVEAPYRPADNRLPVWVVLAAGLALVGVMFLISLRDLNAASDDVAQRALAVPPANMPVITRAGLLAPPPPVPVEPGVADHLRSVLASDIEAKRLSAGGTDGNIVIRVPSAQLFGDGKAVLLGSAAGLIDRVAAALRDQPGTLTVLGYTDNQPIHTVQFPSNFQFSTARARAVQQGLQKGLGAGRTVAVEGRADADPVSTDSSTAGREMNRRVEIVLGRAEGGK